MGYISFENFSKEGLGVKPAPPLHRFFFSRLYEELTEYIFIEYYVIFLEKAIDIIFFFIKVQQGGLRAPYLQTP